MVASRQAHSQNCSIGLLESPVLAAYIRGWTRNLLNERTYTTCGLLYAVDTQSFVSAGKASRLRCILAKSSDRPLFVREVIRALTTFLLWYGRSASVWISLRKVAVKMFSHAADALCIHFFTTWLANWCGANFPKLQSTQLKIRSRSKAKASWIAWLAYGSMMKQYSLLALPNIFSKRCPTTSASRNSVNSTLMIRMPWQSTSKCPALSRTTSSKRLKCVRLSGNVGLNVPSNKSQSLKAWFACWCMRAENKFLRYLPGSVQLRADFMNSKTSKVTASRPFLLKLSQAGDIYFCSLHSTLEGEGCRRAGFIIHHLARIPPFTFPNTQPCSHAHT